MKPPRVLDGMRTLDDVRERCLVHRDDDPDAGCWRLRQGNGRIASPAYRAWNGNTGRSMPVARLVWSFAHPGRPLASSYCVWRCCGTPNCVNPQHLRAGPRSAWGRVLAARGVHKSPARREHCRRIGRARAGCVMTPELRRWLLESPQNGSEAAHGLGITQSRANFIRAEARRLTRAASVFGAGVQP